MAEGVSCMIGNPGTSERNLLDALGAEEFRDLKYYMALQEGSAVAMADAYARALQKPAVVQLHSYAGLANGLGMMYYAKRGYTPLVVIAGEAGLRYDAMDGQMAADLVGMAQPFVKSDQHGPCAWRVVDAGSVVRLLRRAMKAAATPPCGPVFLALPMDILDQPCPEPIVASQPINSIVKPDRETIVRAAGLLASAQRPLILIGDGVAAANAQTELVELSEQLGATVWGANCSEVCMPVAHPLFGGNLGHMFGEASRPVTSAADAVLVCGTTVLPEVFPSLEHVFADGVPVIHFDLNTYEIGKNFPVTIGALANPKPTLAALTDELRRVMSSAQVAQAGARYRQQRNDKSAREATERERDDALQDRVPMHAVQFMRQLAKRLPENALIFDEALTTSPELCRYIIRNIPGTYFQTRSGMLGTGLPCAVGLKVAQPGRIVFGFAGDGGSISTIQALSTAARYNIGTKFVICNNRSYRILKYNLQEYWKTLPGHSNQSFPPEFDLSPPNLRFDLMAQAQGVDAVRVETPDQISPALDRALADDRPFLIELLLSSDL